MNISVFKQPYQDGIYCCKCTVCTQSINFPVCFVMSQVRSFRWCVLPMGHNISSSSPSSRSLCSSRCSLVGCRHRSYNRYVPSHKRSQGLKVGSVALKQLKKKMKYREKPKNKLGNQEDAACSNNTALCRQIAKSKN